MNSVEIETAWQPIRSCFSRAKVGSGIVLYAIAAQKRPMDLTDDVLDSWEAEQIRLGRRFEYVRYIKAAFRKRIEKMGLNERFSSLTPRRSKRYGVSVSQLPEPMRTQLIAVVEWKTAKFLAGRPRGARCRAVSAVHFVKIVGRLYGLSTPFWVNK